MSPRSSETTISNDVSFMAAAGPYLLANGDLSAFEELLRRADEDPAVQTLILVGIYEKRQKTIESRYLYI